MTAHGEPCRRACPGPAARKLASFDIINPECVNTKSRSANGSRPIPQSQIGFVRRLFVPATIPSPSPLFSVSTLPAPRPTPPRPTPHAPRLTPHAPRFPPHAPRLTPHASRPTPHASRPTPHASRLTPHAPRFPPHGPRLTPHASRPRVRSCVDPPPLATACNRPVG